MKAATIINPVIRLFIIPFLVFSLVIPPQQSQAQENSSYPEPSEKFSREELTQMLAPIALYPDVLLSQVLMASTYPIEVIEADRWVKKNPELKDEDLDNALLAEAWDPSVKAVCYFPSILALMSERIAETTNLGNAFLAQEDEVMDIVQELRAKAKAQGNLANTSEQTIIVEKETIIIEPANPRVIYVPYYDPFYIYGPWWYPAYPPYYWGPSRVSIGVGISYWPGFYFGFAFGAWNYFDWHSHHIYINAHRRPRYVRSHRWATKPGPWRHAPRHRRGVAYRDKSTARKYGQYRDRNRAFKRDTRGFSGPGRVDDRRRTDRARIDSDRQVRQRVEGEQQVRQRVESDRQVRQRVEGKQQVRQRNESDRQVRQRVEGEQQVRQRSESDRQVRQRVEGKQQEKQRSKSDRQAQQRVKSEKQQRSRDNVFNRVENGRSERQSSKRGQVSRQRQSVNSSGRGSSGGRNRSQSRGQNRQ